MFINRQIYTSRSLLNLNRIMKICKMNRNILLIDKGIQNKKIESINPIKNLS